MAEAKNPSTTPPAAPGRASVWIALLAFLALALAPVSGRAEDPAAARYVEVMPEATRFGAMLGAPPAATAYRGAEIVGYVLHSRAVVASSGYSGKPLDLLVGIDRNARITGVRLLEHHEPILVIGVADKDLDAFVRQYVGRDIRRPVRVTRRPVAGPDTADAVSGATISSVVINDAILRSARAVARSRGLLGGAASALDFESFEPVDWRTLVDEGSLVSLRLSVSAAAEMMAARGARLFAPGAEPADAAAPFAELYFGLATPARVGRNLAGERLYSRVTGALKAGDQLVFVAGRGLYSFKGTAYVRSGMFDRLQLVQQDQTFRFGKGDHVRIDEVKIEGAPTLREAAFFVLPKESGFSPAEPWRLELIVAGERDSGGTSYVTVGQSYLLPDRYRRRTAVDEGGTPPLWQGVWQARVVDIAIVSIALVALTALLVFQDWVTRRPRLFKAVRNGFLVFTLVWLGWYAGAQLSVLNVLTFAHSLMTGFRWDFFLLEPLIFILWSYVALTLLFWGRGVFCGWLCPFGALQELSGKVARWLKLPELSLPFGLTERLWPLKYVIFVGLFALSLGDLALTQWAAEVEPFKTAVVLRFAREPGFIAYAVVLVGAGLFVERFFCRYLCPLGGALALPARLRMFEWLKRRWQCGLQCHICANTCPVQAIHPDGRINPNECIHCLNCQVLYYDDQVCPPLVERSKRSRSKLTERLVARYEAAENLASAGEGKTDDDAG